jgi:hypothetical protein
MSHTLVLDIPEEAYEELTRSARRKGQSPEKVAAGILADSLTDPVLKLAGCLSFPSADLGERHDEYIGAAIHAESREK